MAIQLAGGGDFPQQQQQMIQAPIVPPQPPKEDHALLWATGVAVPLIVAVLSVWASRRKSK